MDFHDLIKIDNSLIMIVLGISDNAVFYVSVILFERSQYILAYFCCFLAKVTKSV